jgi:hypothetical protein
VGAALASVGVPVHLTPPQAVQPPCVVLVPGSPWLDSAGHASLEVVAHVSQTAGNEAALASLEDLVESIRDGLRAAAVGVHDTDQPRANTDGGTLSVTTYTTLMIRC